MHATVKGCVGSWEMYFINIPVDVGVLTVKQQMASKEYKFIREPDDALKCHQRAR